MLILAIIAFIIATIILVSVFVSKPAAPVKKADSGKVFEMIIHPSTVDTYM